MEQFIIIAASENSHITQGFANSLEEAIEKTKNGNRECMLIANNYTGESNPLLAAISPLVINGNLTAAGRDFSN